MDVLPQAIEQYSPFNIKLKKFFGFFKMHHAKTSTPVHTYGTIYCISVFSFFIL
ncbi:hypothetical protein APHDU1_1349 [Anaplasma phagocytophilum]|nr:hypothetical protein APHDU1_1349 [Anaplasma phagocytophilum]